MGACRYRSTADRSARPKPSGWPRGAAFAAPPAQGARLLWRAGFGARPGEAEKLAKLGLKHAVYAMTRPVPYQLVGPDPKDERNRAPAQVDAAGADPHRARRH